jgi:glucose-1-phosphate thymidylyltransferase
MWAVIPAAGEGSRMSPLTGDVPKSLLEIGGVPVIERVLDQLSPTVTHACIVTSPGATALHDRLGDRHGHMRLHYVDQPLRKGVADAVLCAEPIVRGRFAVVMADAFFGEPLSPYLETWRDGSESGAVLFEDIQDDAEGPMGILQIEDGRVSATWKGLPEAGLRHRNSGAIMFPEGTFDVLRGLRPAESGELELEDAMTELMRTGLSFAAIRYDGWRRNLNTPEDVRWVERRLGLDDTIGTAATAAVPDHARNK